MHFTTPRLLCCQPDFGRCLLIKGRWSMARKTRRARGFVLITMAVAGVAIFGAIGMALDVGRSFIAKNETQAFCDTASLAATLKLDGTSTGIAKAKTAVTNT